MNLHSIHLKTPDENETFQYRWSSFKKIISEIDANSTIGIDGDERKLDHDVVSILQLLSLKKGNMASKSPSEKLGMILSDKQRLHSWIKSYTNEYEKSSEKDSVKIATFREAATRLKIGLDDSDFDEGNFRNERREAIKDINNMLDNIIKL